MVAVFPLLLLFVTILSLAGCAGGYALTQRDGPRSDLAWFSPAAEADRQWLDRWALAVGPPVLQRTEKETAPTDGDTLRVISWNIAVGEGRVLDLLRDLGESHDRSPFVLLLQEVHRSGAEVPAHLGTDARFPGRLGSVADGRRQDIRAIAEAARLHLYYVPSMRNGGPLISSEDRGNAILSSLPLSDFSAIELPFERQRRVAVAATISGVSAAGLPWNLRLVSAHLDNLVGARRGWFAGGEFGRTRQARALIEYLRLEEAVVLGGDFNSWFGFSEKAYLETFLAFPHTQVSDRRPTFGGLLRPDHLFFRLPEGWLAQFERGPQTYGSDHYPLIATIRMR